MISAAKPPLSPTCSTGPHESEPDHLGASLVNIVATEPLDRQAASTIIAMSISSSTTRIRRPTISLPDMLFSFFSGQTLARAQRHPSVECRWCSGDRMDGNPGARPRPFHASVFARLRSRPNPRLRGAAPAIGGPPVSVQTKWSIAPDLWLTVHDTASAPVSVDSAPYFAALLASSWKAMAKDNPALGVTTMSAPVIDRDLPPRS